MSDQPFPTNKPAENVNTAISDVVKTAETLAEKAAETAIETNAPIFALPVIKQVEEFTIEELGNYIGGKISVGLQQIGTFVLIDTQVEGEKTGVSQALANLMTAEKSGDPEKIKEAIKAYANANSSLDHDDGAAPPVR